MAVETHQARAGDSPRRPLCDCGAWPHTHTCTLLTWAVAKHNSGHCPVCGAELMGFQSIGVVYYCPNGHLYKQFGERPQ